MILTPTDDDVMEALRQVLLRIWEGGIEVIQGQDNRVPEPAYPNYIVMTPIGRTRLATNTRTGMGEPLAITTPMRVDIQLDVHGANAANNAQTITTLMRDEWGCQAFGVVGYPVFPLHADDPKQIPFINGEDQYDDRWIVDVRLQANCTLSTIQQYADSLNVTLIEVDATYPPGVN